MERQLQSTTTSATGGGGEAPRERTLLRPEDYIGPVEKRTRELWVYERDAMARRAVTYVPGLHKIFDDVRLYAADNKQRDPAMDSLRVEVDAAQCRISVYCNGRGVPIELHWGEEGVYAPEMVFGHLGNCDHGVEGIAGGWNGYGVRLANIFSAEFVVETVDARREKKYKQVFSENMGNKSETQVTVCLQGVNWTRITFKPDLAKFNMTHLDDDVVALMRKRVVDEGEFQQVSLVNKAATLAGGTHVDYVSDKIAAHFMSFLNQKGLRPKAIPNPMTRIVSKTLNTNAK